MKTITESARQLSVIAEAVVHQLAAKIHPRHRSGEFPQRVGCRTDALGPADGLFDGHDFASCRRFLLRPAVLCPGSRAKWAQGLDQG